MLSKNRPYLFSKLNFLTKTKNRHPARKSLTRIVEKAKMTKDVLFLKSTVVLARSGVENIVLNSLVRLGLLETWVTSLHGMSCLKVHLH